MKKQSTDNPQKLYFTYPNTVAVIVVKERMNVYTMPAVWQIPLSHSPMIFGILVSPKRFTYNKLLSAKNFTLNYFSVEYADLITRLGSCSGKDVDKVNKFHLKLAPSKFIESPILEDAYVSIECEYERHVTFGDHDLIAGKGRNIWFDSSKLENNILSLEKTSPLLYLGNFTYTSTDSKKQIICKR